MSKPDEPIRYRNYYKCSECGKEWQDEWSCTCNDRCPECDTEIEPCKSEDIAPLKEVSIILQMNVESCELLKAQKKELIEAIGKGLLTDQMNGLVHLIDSIQDQMVDDGHFPEDVIFPCMEVSNG